MQNSVKIGLNLLDKLIKQVHKNSIKIPSKKQYSKKRNYHSNQIPNKGFINWNLTSNKIFNYVRAFDYKPYNSFWLEPKIRYKNKIFNVIKVKISNLKSESTPGYISIKKNKLLKISSLDNWIIILKIKLNNSFIDPFEYFTNGDIIVSNNYSEL